ncbi:MAG TPA: DUF4202 domain-containing protein [Polyangiaceae bacterium]|nr:DUF4202 domain-containing protein [Polyangiaceae bacterium]
MSSAIDSMIERAIAEFDRMNSQDPVLIAVGQRQVPRELALALWLSEWIHRVQSSPSVPLRLASRCQHLMRFSVPRSQYPQGRVGYLTWRKDLSKRHADLAGQVLRDVGFDSAVIEQVRKINLKQELKADADCQAMEDALCLSFLDHEYADFCGKHSDEKVVDIVQKTWRKMSEVGQQLALLLPLEGRPKDLVLRALG